MTMIDNPNTASDVPEKSRICDKQKDPRSTWWMTQKFDEKAEAIHRSLESGIQKYSSIFF